MKGAIFDMDGLLLIPNGCISPAGISLPGPWADTALRLCSRITGAAQAGTFSTAQLLSGR